MWSLLFCFNLLVAFRSRPEVLRVGCVACLAFDVLLFLSLDRRESGSVFSSGAGNTKLILLEACDENTDLLS